MFRIPEIKISPTLSLVYSLMYDMVFCMCRYLPTCWPLTDTIDMHWGAHWICEVFVTLRFETPCGRLFTTVGFYGWWRFSTNVGNVATSRTLWVIPQLINICMRNSNVCRIDLLFICLKKNTIYKNSVLLKIIWWSLFKFTQSIHPK